MQIEKEITIAMENLATLCRIGEDGELWAKKEEWSIRAIRIKDGTI